MPCDEPSATLDEPLGSDGLLEKIGRPVLHGPKRHIDVAVAAQKDDRYVPPGLPQFAQTIEPRHPLHAHVENDAPRTADVVVPKKGFGAFKTDSVESRHAESEDLRGTEFTVVVDQADQGGEHSDYIR